MRYNHQLHCIMVFKHQFNKYLYKVENFQVKHVSMSILNIWKYVY